MLHVREFRPNDDFDFFNRLVWDEHKRRTQRLRGNIHGPFSVDDSY